MSNVKLIRESLEAAGYTDNEPTIENLIECYIDYAVCYGGDVEEIREDIANGEITIQQMCKRLIRCN